MRLGVAYVLSLALAACHSGSSSNDGSVKNDGSVDHDGGAPDAGRSTDAAQPVQTTRPFEALHTYYVAASGDDSAAGSKDAPWASPKHAVQCGDVIIVEAGSYTNQFGAGSWGTVSSCPSTSGGIDGQGGIYFATLLCAGPNLGACSVNGGMYEAIRVDESNWAIEGFSGTQSASANGGCYSIASDTTATLHHVAFINNVASHCALAGFDSYSYMANNTGGIDQQAIVGAIAFDGAPSTNGSGLCGSGVSLIPQNGPDTSSGTHVFVAGVFSYGNVNAPSGAGCNTDGEGLIFDSWGVPQYKYQAVAEQNVLWGNGSAGFEAFPQGNGSSDDQVTVVFKNNTSYGNYQDPKNPGGGELFMNQVYPTTGSYTFTDNVFEATNASPGNNGTGKVVGAEIDCLNNCSSSVMSVSDNVIWSSHAPTSTAAGGGNTHAYYGGMDQGANFPFGTNTFGDPGLASPSTLPTTAPDCSSYATTTACMNVGYNVAASVTPSSAAAGKGYASPASCAPDALYPSWLKGVVHLTWDGTNLAQSEGLITKPCNL